MRAHSSRRLSGRRLSGRRPSGRRPSRRRPSRRRPCVAAGLALAATALTACGVPAQGGGPHDQAVAAAASSPSALDGLPAEQVLATARRAVADAPSGRVSVTVTGGSEVPVQLSVDRDGDREVWLRRGTVEVTLRVVGGRGWVSGAYPVGDRLVPVPDGSWVAAPRPDDVLAAMGRLSGGRAADSLPALVDGALGPAGQPVVLAGRGDAGVQTVVLTLGTGSTGRTVHVAAQGTPAPVQVVTGAGDTVLEADWDDPVAVDAPDPDDVVPLPAA